MQVLSRVRVSQGVARFLLPALKIIQKHWKASEGLPRTLLQVVGIKVIQRRGIEGWLYCLKYRLSLWTLSIDWGIKKRYKNARTTGRTRVTQYHVSEMFVKLKQGNNSIHREKERFALKQSKQLSFKLIITEATFGPPAPANRGWMKITILLVYMVWSHASNPSLASSRWTSFITCACIKHFTQWAGEGEREAITNY